MARATGDTQHATSCCATAASHRTIFYKRLQAAGSWTGQFSAYENMFKYALPYHAP